MTLNVEGPTGRAYALMLQSNTSSALVERCSCSRRHIQNFVNTNPRQVPRLVLATSRKGH